MPPKLLSYIFCVQFVADGVFYAELNEFFTRQLSEAGYSGLQIKVTAQRTEVIIRATRPSSVLGERGTKIKELTMLIQKRFNFADGAIELFIERVENRGLCAIAQCESLRFKLLNSVAVRKACYSVLRSAMEAGAKGCEVIVSGKIRGQRAKSMKFSDGFMVHSGQPATDYIDQAARHVLLRQGVLGVKVKIMLPHDPTGRIGPKNPLPDHVLIYEPKEDESRMNVAIETQDLTLSARPPVTPIEEGISKMGINEIPSQ